MRVNRNRIMRAVLSAVVVAGTAGGLGVVGAGGASASSPCSGTLVWGPTPFYGEGAYSNTVVAYVDTYWDGSSNCEVAYKNVFVGEATRMDLTIWTNYGSTDDPGNWKYYAGPVSEPGAGSCVWEEVDMWDPSGHEIAQEYDNSPHSCG